jgi:hypothetical protein
LADVVEKAVNRDDAAAALFDRDRGAVDRPPGLGDGGEVGLDVAAALQLGEAAQSGVDLGEVAAELLVWSPCRRPSSGSASRRGA